MAKIPQTITYPNPNSDLHDQTVAKLNAEAKAYFDHALLAYLSATVSQGVWSAALTYAKSSAASQQLV